IASLHAQGRIPHAGLLHFVRKDMPDKKTLSLKSPLSSTQEHRPKTLPLFPYFPVPKQLFTSYMIAANEKRERR
ncbi:MAG: hypothetical protein LBB84_03850, partial [Tannerellaceae bacterium]|nr:hypothetical protein [Tannerellaceae bacterium]